MLACDRNITKGAVIMGAAVAESGENTIRLADAGGEIPCGGSLALGASGLTFRWPFAASLEHFIIEATASAGSDGAWGIEGGSCGKRRAVDTVARKFTVPPGGSVAVRAAWATGFGTPSVTTTCEYTVQCPPGYSGNTCETSQCPAQRVPSAVQPTASYPTGHVCVPEGLRQHADVAHCAFDKSWRQIISHWQTMPLSDRFTTGGLGKLMAMDEFEVWLCDKQTPCTLANAEVCYVFSERHLVFVPWGKRVNVLATPAPGLTPTTGGLCAMVIDVRTESEWDAGHVSCALRLEIPERPNGWQAQIAALTASQKSTHIIVYCRSDTCAEVAKQVLFQKGHASVKSPLYSNFI
jgi:rhodanese-related sulfurtransferase